MDGKLYAKRDIIGQGEFYTRHVMAMTAEGLHDKSSIAAELAHRDQRIAELERMLSSCIDDLQAEAESLRPGEPYESMTDEPAIIGRARDLLNQEEGG